MRANPMIGAAATVSENSSDKLRIAVSSSPASIQTPLQFGHTSSTASATGRLTMPPPQRGHMTPASSAA